MTWAELFDRADGTDASVAAVGDRLAERRAETAERGADAADAESIENDPPAPSPARVVADADVLAADLLVGGAARDALDLLRRHSWTTLVASDPLLDDATAVVGALADEGLAADWRERVAAWREPVRHPASDHPALGSAYRGNAMQVLSLDDRLTSAAAGVTLNGRVQVSVREPRAFAAVFDPERLYPDAVGGEYPGPDRDPRA